MIKRIEYGGRQYLNIPDNGEGFDIPAEVLRNAVESQKWEGVRHKRDSLLRSCDYASMPDYPLTDAQRAEVTAYRQALRDIPESAADPDAVEWPTKPECLSQ